MSSIGDRLREIRNQKGLNQADFGALAGVTKRTQMLYEGNERSPKADYLLALDTEGLDVTYILTGRRSAEPQAERVSDNAPVATASEPGPGLAAVKLYDVEGAAGDGRSLEEERVEGMLYFPEAQLSALGLNAEQVAGVKVRGDSMLGTLDDGDWVLVDRTNRDPRQEGVFLLLVSGERRIKRVQRLAGGALYLISDNDHYQPEMIKPQDMHDVEILGRCEIRIGRVS
ncbi:hypothetical protein GLV89_01715 [Halomonas alkaliantarctica]|nr:hypothetical protein [Halomonas alkaliantarctica]